MSSTEFDYIVIGGGSAGCVVASRLSENPNINVCLLEAGKPDSNVLIHAPAGVAAMVPNGINSWHYDTVPQKGFNGRKGFQPRGKTLGGSSSINGMIYSRGNRWDYDNWASLGNEGWSYDDVLPYFKKAENNETFTDDPYHGSGGPLNVAEVSCPSPINDVFLEACQLNGIPYNKDVNGETQLGCRMTQVTQKNGERWSAAKGYITPNLNRPNLTVMTQAHVRRIIIEDKTAVGVCIQKDGKQLNIHAKQEVILSAGAYGSPQILELSGVGSKEHLERIGITLKHELPGVGENLQDHISTIPIYRAKHNTGTFGLSLSGGWAMLKGILEWKNKRTGIVTSNFAESMAFAQIDPNEPCPDVALELLTGIVDDHARKMHVGHGYCVHATLLRPKSIGSVHCNSADPLEPPMIDPNFFDDEDDLERLAKGLQLTLEVMESKPFDSLKSKMLYPLDRHNLEELKQYCKDQADTEYHPVGTCKMGPDTDPMAVVDAELRVKGINSLRVIDASIMPFLISGNTNAPSIMIGEKGADLIRQAQ